MSDDETFNGAEELKAWLTKRGVDEEDEEEGGASQKLFDRKYNRPSTLVGISSDALQRAGLSDPLAQHISNKLKAEPFRWQSSPSQPRQPQVHPPPPSDGKQPAKRIKVSSLAPPSGDENTPTSNRSALKYVASDPLCCSSSMIALHVLQLLENAVKCDQEDEKYKAAAAYILKIRGALRGNLLNEEDINKNERFFTGAFCDALNTVTRNGISVLHQGCIGHNATHSDFSARNILCRDGSSTLMVGEGKAGTSDEIRHQTRGQVFNELIRHRKIDAKLGFEMGARPVLLLAVNFGYIALDLAFPSKKGNSMEKKEWVVFQPSLTEGTETFWTTPIASVKYSQGAGEKKLPKVLRFIADTLKYLQELDVNLPRQQFKTPFISTPEEAANNGEKRGDNVTILETKSGKRVYKEFCYYLRQDDGFNEWDHTVLKNDQRKPPSTELLQGLGQPYIHWKVENGPFGIQILSYDFIEGVCWPTSKDTWIQVLQQVATMHRLGYVHGDLLPRNVVFSALAGHVIDFDLTRKEGERYVRRYNHSDFTAFRHEDACAGRIMKKEHDTWALVKMTEEFFEIDLSPSITTVKDLIRQFSEAQSCELRKVDTSVLNEATGPK